MWTTRRRLRGTHRGVTVLSRLFDAFGRPNRLVGRLFSHVRVDDADKAAVAEASKRGPVVFVMRAVSAIDALALWALMASWKLPPVTFTHDLPAVPEALIAPRGRAPRSVPPTQALREALSRGDSAVIFLKRPPSVFSTTGRAHLEGDDLLETVAKYVAETGQDVTLFPTVCFWTLRPEKVGLSPLDIVFGRSDMPGDVRAVAQFLVNYQHGTVRMAEALSVAASPATVSAARAEPSVRQLTFALLRKIERERRATLGPVQKAPDRVRLEVLRSPRLTKLIDDLSNGDADKRAAIEAKSRRMLDGLAAEPNPDMLRAIEPVADRLVNRVFSAVDVDAEGVEQLREASRRGTVVLLPCHKSHVDYLVLSYVLRKHLLELPMVAAGDNLAFFPVGELLRRGGAFFIRRDFRGDRLYAAVVDAYVRRLLRDGYAIEFYLEGGRSRTGKLLPLKLGLLNLVVDTALALEGRPVAFVPVHIGYERVMEDFELAHERAGGKKRREGPRSLLAVADALSYDYGRVSVTFASPIELSNVRAELGLDPTAPPSPAKRRAVTNRVAEKVAQGIHHAARLSAGSLVAMALLDMPGRGLPHPVLVRRVERLLVVGMRAGARPVPGLVHGDGRIREAAVRDAAVMFVRGGLVKEHAPDATIERSGRSEPPRSRDDVVYTVPDDARVRLDFTKNGILHFYVERALVSLAFRVVGVRAVPRARIVEGAEALAKLLVYDISSVTDSAGGLTSRLEATVDDMIAFGELAGAGDQITVGPGNAEDDAMAHLSAHCAHLTPVLEAYRIAARTVRLLVTESLEDKDLMTQALSVGRQMFLGGEIDRQEAISTPTLGAAFEAFVARGVLKRGKDRYEVAGEAAEAEVRALESWIAAHLSPSLWGVHRS